MEKLKRISCFILKTVFIALLFTTGIIIHNFQSINTHLAQNTTPIVEQVKPSEDVFALWNKAITVRAVDLQNNLVIRHRTVFRGRIEARGGIWSELEIFEGADGRLYKCVDPFVAPASGTFTKEAIPDTYHFATINRIITFTPELKDKLALINYFGDQETPGLDRSVYTNLMIWDTLLPDYYGEHTRFVGTPPEINITAYNNFKNEVNEKIRKYKVMPSFDNTTVTLRVGESKIIEDTNAVLDTVRVNDSNGFTFEKLDNRRLKVTATSNATSARLRFRKNIDPSKQYQSVFYHKPGSQKMGLFGVTDPLHASVSFNVEKTATVKIVKTDELGRKVPGVVFEVSRERDFANNPFTATTNNQGEIVDAGWALTPTSKVYVREKSVPDHLVKSVEVKEVQLVAGQTSTVSFVNNLKRGHLELIKVDGENSNTKLENAVFELLKDNQVIATKTSNTEGKVVFNDLLPGDYVVREKTAPTGYRLNTNTLNVTIEPGQTNRQNFSNFKIKGNIEILKVADEDNTKKLSGAIFQLKQGDKVYAERTTNEQGLARFENLNYGNYTLVEKVAPTGYVLNLNPIDVFVNIHNKTYTYAVENVKIKGNIEVLKVAEHDTAFKLEGAVFELRKGTEVIATATTNVEGIARFENVEYGSYTLVETKSPEGYFLKSFEKEVVINQNKQVITFTVENEKQPSIQTQAHGKDLRPQELVEPTEKTLIYEHTLVKNVVPNAPYKVTVYGIDPVTKKVLVTEEHEFIPTTTEYTKRFEWTLNGFELPNGITFSETLHRKNEKGEWVFKHRHNENGEDKDQTVKFKKYGSIKVRKVDSESGELIQATMKFGLFRDGKLIEEVFTKEGVAKFKTRLIIDPKIVYEVKELEAPERYIKSEEVLKVVLTEEDAHQVKEFSYNNTLLPTIKTKIDSSDNANVIIYTIAGFISFVGLFLLKRKQD